MGGKAGTASTGNNSASDIAAFVAGISTEHRETFDALRALIKRVAPGTTESLKWGTLAYDQDGSLFALSAPKKDVNLYILELGIIAAHPEEVAGIPRSNCVLRFRAGVKPPIAKLTRVMKAAVAAKG